MTAYKQCPRCQQPAEIQAAYCSHCRHQFRTQFAPPDQTQMYGMPAHPAPLPAKPDPGVIQFTPGTHSVFLAGVLAIFCCGAVAQMYNRQFLKAIVCLLASMAFAVLTGGVSLVITYPVLVFDAIGVAGRLTRGEAVSQWQFF